MIDHCQKCTVRRRDATRFVVSYAVCIDFLVDSSWVSFDRVQYVRHSCSRYGSDTVRSVDPFLGQTEDQSIYQGPRWKDICYELKAATKIVLSAKIFH